MCMPDILEQRVVHCTWLFKQLSTLLRINTQKDPWKILLRASIIGSELKLKLCKNNNRVGIH